VPMRRGELRASKILQQRLFANPKVEVIWNSVVDEVKADEQGLVSKLILRNVETNATSELAAQAMFVFIGFRPNTGIIEGHIEDRLDVFGAIDPLHMERL